MSKFCAVVALEEVDRGREHDEVRERDAGEEQQRAPTSITGIAIRFSVGFERGDHERVRLVDEHRQREQQREVRRRPSAWS